MRGWFNNERKQLDFVWSTVSTTRAKFLKQGRIEKSPGHGFGADADWIWTIKEVLPQAEILSAKSGFVYFVLNRGLTKIGCTSMNPIDRIGSLFPSNHPKDGEVILLHVISTNHKYKIEREFHDYYADKRIGGEWFKLTNKDIKMIREIDEI